MGVSSLMLPKRYSGTLEDTIFLFFSDVQQLDNGTLIIESVETRHSGRYVCRHRDDSISYELKVQG